VPDKIVELLGTGAGGGLLGAIVAFFGLKSRMDRMEGSAVSRDTCAAVQREFTGRIGDLQRSLDSFREDTTERLGRIEGRVDAIYRNGKGTAGSA
jgi:hypothetical protein